MKLVATPKMPATAVMRTLPSCGGVTVGAAWLVLELDEAAHVGVTLTWALVPVTRSTAAMFADAELPVKVHDDGSLAAVLV